MGAHYRFKQADVKRAIKGAQDAGFRIGLIRIDPNGSIEITPAGATQRAQGNSCDDLA